MATVTITITDAPGGITTVVESEPEIPLLADGDPDLERATPAQAFAIGALIAFTDSLPNVDWRVFFR